MFFGLKSIKDAWALPSTAAKTGEPSNQESDEFAEAEELVKEKVIYFFISFLFTASDALFHLSLPENVLNI